MLLSLTSLSVMSLSAKVALLAVLGYDNSKQGSYRSSKTKFPDFP